jgi:hypothetical protein
VGREISLGAVPRRTRGPGRQTAAVVLVAAAACTAGPSWTRLANPLRLGRVAVNRVVSDDVATSREYGLPPGALADEARLVALDRTRACFALTLRAESENADQASLAGWQIRLIRPERLAWSEPSSAETAATETAVYNGRRTREEYLGDGVRCSSDPVSQRLGARTRSGAQWNDRGGRHCGVAGQTGPVVERAMVTVVRGGGTVCFAHGGAIDRATRDVQLELRSWNPPDRDLVFRWELAP